MIRALPSIRSLASFITIVHLLLILSVPYWISTEKKAKPKEKKITVQTIALTPPTSKIKASETKPTPVKTSVPKQAVEEIKEPIAAAEEPKITKPAPTPAASPAKKEPKKPSASVKESEKKKPTVSSEKKKPEKKSEKSKPVEKKSKAAPAKPKSTQTGKKATESKPKEASAKSKPSDTKTENQTKALSNKAKKEAYEQQQAEIKNSTKAKQKTLIASAQKTISQISSSHGKLSTKMDDSYLGALKGIENLQVETFTGEVEGSLNSYEITYYQELASRLKLLLRLPKYGEVKVKLTLNRAGEFIKLAIDKAENSENRKYLEQKLPGLKYPAFGNNFKEKDQFTFILSISNEL